MEENGKDASGGSTGYIRIGGEFCKLKREKFNSTNKLKKYVAVVLAMVIIMTLIPTMQGNAAQYTVYFKDGYTGESV